MSQEMGFIELTPTHSKRNSVNNINAPGKPPRHSKDHQRKPHRTHHRSKENNNGVAVGVTLVNGQQDLGYFVLEAAKKGNVDDLENLLRDGVDPNVIDEFGHSPLHLAVSVGCSCGTCVRDAESCVVLLLTSNPGTLNVNLQDSTGSTALHLAIHNQLTKCADMLISYGADVTIPSDAGEDAVRLMTKKLPHSFLHLLNESIFIDQFDPHHEKCSVKVDFRPAIAWNDLDEKPHLNPKGRSKSSSKSKRDDQFIREMSLSMNLLQIGHHSAEKILTHPLLQIFLFLKWQRVKKIFWSSFVAYMLWVMLYTGYVLDVYVMSCPCEFYNLKPVANSTNGENATIIRDNRCEIATGLNAEVIIIIASVVLLMLTEIGKFVITPRVYCKSWLNFLNWILVILVFCTTIPNLTAQSSISPVQYQAAALTVFLSWAFVLTQISRFPSLAKYVDIFGHIIKCFGSFILTFASLFMAFALAFCVLFPGENSPFANFSHSVLKVLVMMIGEVDYQEMFYKDDQVTGPVMGHLLYALFAILVCIILMNLFIGLTVSDIQALEKQAEFARICRLVIEMYHLESAVFSKRMPRPIGRILKSFLSINLPDYQYSFRPNRPDKKNLLPKSLTRKAVQVAEISFHKSRSQRCTKGQPGGPATLNPDAELVEVQSYFSHQPSSVSSSTSNSQSSSPLETNSLDMGDMGTRHDYLAHLRSWNSCVDRLRTS